MIFKDQYSEIFVQKYSNIRIIFGFENCHESNTNINIRSYTVRYQLDLAHLFSRQTEIINNKYSQFGNKCPGFVWHKSSGITMTLIPKQTISLKRKFVVSFYLGKINAHSYSTRLNFLSYLSF